MNNRIIKTNFHTHTTFADGKSSAEEMVLSAIGHGCEAIGFSEHGYTPIDISWCMQPDTTEDYIREINSLKEKYKGKIKIYCGIEADYYTEYDKSKFDYSIGSVHYVKVGDVYFPTDLSAAATDEYTERLYGGDYLAYARDYYALVADVLRKTDADIIGHFDVLCKFNEIAPRIDERSSEYVKLATDAIDALIPCNKPFEINTGAISRSYRTTPYPASHFVDYIGACGGKIIMSSDSHNADNVVAGLDEAYEHIIARGFPKENVLFYPF